MHVNKCIPCIIQNSVCPRFKFGYFFGSGVLKNYSFSVNMVRRRISEAQRWQISGMRSTVISCNAIGHGPLLYSSQSAGETTHPNQHRERLSKMRKTTCNVAAWIQGTASLGQTEVIRNQPCSETDNGYQIDVCQQEQWGTVWISRTEVKE
jgi:hypothetical protein